VVFLFGPWRYLPYNATTGEARYARPFATPFNYFNEVIVGGIVEGTPLVSPTTNYTYKGETKWTAVF